MLAEPNTYAGHVLAPAFPELPEGTLITAILPARIDWQGNPAGHVTRTGTVYGTQHTPGRAPKYGFTDEHGNRWLASPSQVVAYTVPGEYDPFEADDPFLIFADEPQIVDRKEARRAYRRALDEISQQKAWEAGADLRDAA